MYWFSRHLFSSLEKQGMQIWVAMKEAWKNETKSTLSPPQRAFIFSSCVFSFFPPCKKKQKICLPKGKPPFSTVSKCTGLLITYAFWTWRKKSVQLLTSVISQGDNYENWEYFVTAFTKSGGREKYYKLVTALMHRCEYFSNHHVI